MKTMILAAISVLSLSVGSAYAQGVPPGAGYNTQYGTAWSNQHSVISKNADNAKHS